jgi:Protein of unknown function (DUF3182)
MAIGNVLIYFSRFGKPLQTHHKIVLDLAAKTIAKIKGYDFGGHYDPTRDYPGPLYFVPDDTVLLNEASCLGIRYSNDLYGGVVPYLFAKTKAITHGLVDRHAERPLGWCSAFAERVREIVLPGYTVFCSRDARVAASRMLTRGPIRLKKPLSASGRDQTVVTTWNELDAVLEKVTEDEMATYGLVLEENLRQVRTLSIGEIAVGSLRLSYHGTQRTVSDNGGRPVYGGSDLVCMRGVGWEAIDALPMLPEVRAAVVAARRYDEATGSSMASRHRAGTTMSLRESALTVGHDQECSSLRGALVARAAPSSGHWQPSLGTRRCGSSAHPTSRNMAKVAELPQMRSSIFRGRIPRRAQCSDTRS